MRQKIYAYIEDEFSIFHDFMWKWSSMLNYLWAAMIVIGIVYGAFTGNMTAVSDGALDSAKEAVTLCITMLGVMSLCLLYTSTGFTCGCGTCTCSTCSGRHFRN